jgi:hypothetical protein
MKKFILAAIAFIMFFGFSQNDTLASTAHPLPDGSVYYEYHGIANGFGFVKANWVTATGPNVKEGEKVCSDVQSSVCPKWSWFTPAKDILGVVYTDPTDPLQCLADLQSEISVHMPELLNPWYGFNMAQEESGDTLDVPTETPIMEFIVYPILP